MIEHVLPVGLVAIVSFVGASVFQSQFSPKEGRLILASWVAHFIFTFLNAWMILYVFGRGDPLAFHDAGIERADYLRLDFVQYAPELFHSIFQTPYGEMFRGKPSTNTVRSLTGVACFLLQDSFWGISLAFTMASFFGKGFMYQAIRPMVPVQRRLHAVVAMMLMPSVIYWSAGIIKESIVISFMGVIGLGIHLARRNLLVGFAVAVFGLYGVSMIKPFILLAILAGGVAYAYWQRAVARGNIEFRPMSLVLVGGAGVVGVLAFGTVFPQFSVNSLIDTTQTISSKGFAGGSKYSLGIGTGLVGLVTSAPMGLFAGWFRPSLLDVRNPQTLVNALETTTLMVLFGRELRKSGWGGIRTSMINNPIVVFCWVYALIMGMGTGLASGNLGTLSRYRMPLVPFLALAVFLMRPVRRRSTPTQRSPRRG